MTQRYLIVFTDSSAGYSNWFDYENNWSDLVYMVIDFQNDTYTIDGQTWIDCEEDNL